MRIRRCVCWNSRLQQNRAPYKCGMAYWQHGLVIYLTVTTAHATIGPQFIYLRPESIELVYETIATS
jgi:hypothetical protein